MKNQTIKSLSKSLSVQYLLRSNVSNLKATLILVILLLASVLFLGINFYNDIFYYPRSSILTVQLKLSKSEVGRAKLHLAAAENLLKNFQALQQHNPQDRRLFNIAKVISKQESEAILDMDLAKKRGENIKTEVKVLCEKLLAPQRQLFYQAINKMPPDLINEMILLLSQTDKNISEGINW